MAEVAGSSKPRGLVRSLVRLSVAALGLSAVVAGLYFGSTAEESTGLGPADSPAGRDEPEEPKRPDITGLGDVSWDPVDLVGSLTCAECHPGEAARHAESGHSRTLRSAPLAAVAEWLDGRTVDDPERAGTSWSYRRSEGKLEVEREEAGEAERLDLELAVGSGSNGTTFITTRPERSKGLGATGLEHRLSYSADGPKMVVTTGHAAMDGKLDEVPIGPRGRELDEVALDNCLKCHATITGPTPRSGVDMAVLRPNVDCERCHGPGKAHVEAARRGAPAEALAMPHGSAPISPVIQINLCGDCHRRLDNLPVKDVTVTNTELARFPSLGIQLSSCFNYGGSGLNCASCHDVHSKVKKDTTSYESVCMGCHNPLKKNNCTVSTTEGCIGCHMPRRKVSGGLEFHDHWIRVPEKAAPTD